MAKELVCHSACLHTQDNVVNLVMSFTLSLAELQLFNYLCTSKIPVRWPGQCYGFTLSLIFKYCGGI